MSESSVAIGSMAAEWLMMRQVTIHPIIQTKANTTKEPMEPNRGDEKAAVANVPATMGPQARARLPPIS